MSVTGLAGMYNIKGLVPELLPPEEIFAGVATPCRLRIRNTKRWLPSFLIRLECPGGRVATIPIVPRRGAAEGSLGLTFSERGRAGIGAVTVSSTFPVNFFTRYWIFPEEREVIVFPRLSPGMPAGGVHEAKRTGESIRQDRGVDGELERISAYSGKEPLRMIHWKLSARSDELLVKEFGRQAAAPLIIDLDTRDGLDPEERISRAAWLVKHWVRQRPVGLRLGGRTIPAEAGHRHGLKLLTELALLGKEEN